MKTKARWETTDCWAVIRTFFWSIAHEWISFFSFVVSDCSNVVLDQPVLRCLSNVSMFWYRLRNVPCWTLVIWKLYSKCWRRIDEICFTIKILLKCSPKTGFSFLLKVSSAIDKSVPPDKLFEFENQEWKPRWKLLFGIESKTLLFNVNCSNVFELCVNPHIVENYRLRDWNRLLSYEIS